MTKERLAGIIISLLLLLGVLFASVFVVGQHLEMRVIKNYSQQDLIRRGEAILAGERATPPLRIGIAESLIDSDSSTDPLARQLLMSAIDQNANQPFAWAQVAFVEARQAGRLDEAALTALSRSIEQCKFCNDDLMKWRLEFVLAHWNDVPHDVRIDIFEGADFLYWWHHEEDYIDQMRRSAQAKEIPYETYRYLVMSPAE